MSEVKLIRIVAANGKGIPASLKTYGSINIQVDPNGQGRSKVISVNQQRPVEGRKSPSQDKRSGQEHSARSDEDADGVPLSKNALLARENRRKRKQYVTNLEADLAAMSKENASLKGQLADKDCKVALMEREIIYLKGVLANVEEISGLIRTIKGSSSLPISSSFHPPAKKMKTERLSESSTGDSGMLLGDSEWNLCNLPDTPQPDPHYDFDCLPDIDNEMFTARDPYTSLSPQVPAGVCLHVQDKKLSLEFCSVCSSRALENWAEQV